ADVDQHVVDVAIDVRDQRRLLKALDTRRLLDNAAQRFLLGRIGLDGAVGLGWRRARSAAGDKRQSRDERESPMEGCHDCTPSKCRLSGSSGSSDTDATEAPVCTMAKIAGRISSVVPVAAIRPPITARPSGATCWPPSPSARAIGVMPAIIAKLVMRIGRR